MKTFQYNRKKAVEYAYRWALGRNPAYYNFDGLGGDCTNFISQCIFAGSGVMNYTPVTGWFYRSPDDRTASWTGVDYLFSFITENMSVGPFGSVCSINELRIGDVIQLGTLEEEYYHSLLVLQTDLEIRIAAHTGDALNRSLRSYTFDSMRCIHIEGVRTW